MCGHVGVAGSMKLATANMMLDLLFMDQLRGAHGTGVALIPYRMDDRTPEKTALHKLPVSASKFLDITEFSNDIKKLTNGIIIGHNRHATQGAHIYNNTHPFFSEADGGLIGAHNGTVKMLHNLPYKTGNFGTDSQRIIENLSREGAKETISNIRETDSYSLVWYKYNTNQLCFIRNSQRPMCYAFTDDMKTLIWASESYMLKAAAARNGVKLESSSDKRYIPLVRETAVDTLMEFTVPEKEEVFPKPKRSKIAGKKYTPPQTRYTPNYTHTSGTEGSKTTTTAGKKSNEKTGREVVVADETIIPFPKQKGGERSIQIRGIKYTDHELRSVISRAHTDCVICGSPILDEEFLDRSAQIFSGHNCVCADCVEDSDNIDSYTVAALLH